MATRLTHGNVRSDDDVDRMEPILIALSQPMCPGCESMGGGMGVGMVVALALGIALIGALVALSIFLIRRSAR
jgi:hypothetical protein